MGGPGDLATRFGTDHAFQAPPGRGAAQVSSEKFERIPFTEQLGYHSVWLPEQHFFDYCIYPDALDLAAYVVAVTSRVRVGAAVVNLSLTHCGSPSAPPCSTSSVVAASTSAWDVDTSCRRRHIRCDGGVDHVDVAEALDIILAAWRDGPSGYADKHYSFPPIQTFPRPHRLVNEILLYGIGGTTPVAGTAESFGKYVAALQSSSLSEEEVDRLLDRAFVLFYALVAPTAQEAQEHVLRSMRLFDEHVMADSYSSRL